MFTCKFFNFSTKSLVLSLKYWGFLSIHHNSKRDHLGKFQFLYFQVNTPHANGEYAKSHIFSYKLISDNHTSYCLYNVIWILNCLNLW